MADGLPDGVDLGAMRHIAAHPERWPTAGPQLLNDAADEINRLQAERRNAIAYLRDALLWTDSGGDCASRIHDAIRSLTEDGEPDE